VLGWANLIYLGALPALATLAVVARHGSPELRALGETTRLLIGVAGFAAVAVQLAVLVTYTRFPASPLTALLVLVDGPVVALASCRSLSSVVDLAIRAFLTDGTAVWLAIGALSLTTPKLEASERKVPVLLMLGMLACIAGLFSPYLAHDLPWTLASVGPLVVGIAWATVVNYRVLASDEVVREGGSGPAMAYLLGFALAWLVGYGVGVALHPSPPGDAPGAAARASGR
jgi:hypothetical protein